MCPIVLDGVFYTYQTHTPYEVPALKNINLKIDEGEFLGIIGHTGSGKSTLIQHFNALLKPTQGRVIVDEVDITQKGVQLRNIRQKVGLVFQYPEHQLFEETVFADIAFGPKNIGLSEPEVKKRVKGAMKMVQLDYEAYRSLSPFLLSGGEKRRVAIAGVLAMKPKYLILDEPTAGLDPRGREEILTHIRTLHEKEGLTVVIVTHSMDDVARLAHRLVVLDRGEIAYNEEPRKVFSEHDRIQEMGLDIPTVNKLMIKLQKKGWPVRSNLLTIEEAQEEILKVIRGEQQDA